jgi:glutathione peroxidase
MTTLGDFSATSIEGQQTDLSTYQGQVVLVVNTASECGYASQLPALQQLHETYRDRGFTVLGFPSNQFNQEPRDDGDIATFCERNHGVSFPMFSTVEVNGDGAHPVYKWLKDEKGGAFGSKIRWNFTKYLVGRDGHVVKRFSPTTEPEKLVDTIEEALG